MRRKLPPGFTLIELLTVIAIIAILASLVLASAGFVQDKGARARAEAEIAALSAALESYKVDNGDYPTSTLSGTPAASKTPATNNLYTYLAGATGESNSTKPYYEFKKTMTNSTKSTVDPWGNNYGYIYTSTNTEGFLLWSTANKTNSNAWLKNW